MAEPERAGLQAHLDACESCRREMTLCRSAEAVLSSASAQIPPAGDLRASFYLRLAAQQRQPRRYGRPFALSALAAGVVALALIRPVLHTGVVPPAGTGNRVTPLAAALPPAVPAHSLPVTKTADAMRVTLRTIPGLPEAEADRLFASVSVKRRMPGRDREALRRSTRRTYAVRQIRHPLVTPALFAKVDFVRNSYSYGESLEKAPEGRMFADAGTTGFGTRGKQEIVFGLETSGRDLRGDGRLVAAVDSGEAGVSLEVTDQVRGFRNTTRVASAVEVRDGSSTIHVEADGN